MWSFPLLAALAAPSVPGEQVLRAMPFGMGELVIVFLIVVVLFGATKLPQLGKGLGEAIGNFKRAQRESDQLREEIDATPRLDTADRVDLPKGERRS